jgi:hypothetical protein
MEGIMKRTAAIIVLLVSALFLAAGLLFLCAAMREPSRLLLAALLLVIGAAGAAWSAVSLRRLRELDPEKVSDRITALAKASGNGEVTLSEVVADLGVPNEVAIAAFNLLERRGEAHRDRVGERDIYVFPGLQPSKVMRRCPYCGGEFSVKTPVYKCPHCGGDLRLVRE